MIECIRFILQQLVNFCSMLFTIDIGNNMSLGLIFCIIFIFLPVVLHVLTVIKHSVLGDLDYMITEDISLLPKKQKKGRGK